MKSDYKKKEKPFYVCDFFNYDMPVDYYPEEGGGGGGGGNVENSV